MIMKSLSIIAFQSLFIIVFLKSTCDSTTQNLSIIISYTINVINDYKFNKTLILFFINYEK